MGRTLRVLYIIDKMPLGGTQTHLDTVIRTIADTHRVEPALCCINGLCELAEGLRADGVLVLNLGLTRLASLRGLSGTVKLSRTIREGGFDLVHAYLFSSNLIAPVAARMAGVPVITSRRDTGFWAARRHILACRLVNRMTNAITVNSEAVLRATLRREAPDRSKIYLIPNGIRPSRPAERGGQWTVDGGRRVRLLKSGDSGVAGKSSRTGRSPAVIGTIGNLKPVKGHAAMIRAFGLLLQSDRNLSLHLYGDGPEKQRLRCTADAVGLNGQVHFESGRAADQVLGKIDIFVLPSLSEGCSNALLEAMASGLPVVATDIPANREIIRDGVDGLLVPVGDYAKMAEAIRVLIESPEKRSALGTAAVQTARRYSVEAMIDRTRRLYDRVLEESKPANGTAR